MTDNLPSFLPLQLASDSIGTGPNLVILHGLFGDGENWRNQAKKLAISFTVDSLDMRNHGASPHSSQINYPAMAADVKHTCENLGLQKFHLLGHSMGGKTAMQLALDHPSLVERLIIVDIAPKQYPHHHQMVLDGLTQLQALSRLGNLTSRRQADTVLAEFIGERQTRAFLLKNLQRTESGEYQLRINLDAIVRGYGSIAAAVPAHPTAPWQGPVLFIKGAESDYLQTEDKATITGLFPNATLKTIGGAGHWPQSEKPDVVYKIINSFLKR